MSITTSTNENTGLPDYIYRIIEESKRRFRNEISLSAGDEPYLAKKVAETLRICAGDAPIRVDSGRVFFYCADPSSSHFGIWSECPRDLIHGAILELRGRPLTKRDKNGPKKVTMTAKKARAILDCILHDSDLLRVGFFNIPSSGVVFEDCVVTLDMDRKELVKVPHAPSFRLRSKLGFAFGEHQETPEKFLSVLAKDFEGDDESTVKIELIREFIGACLLGIQPRYDCCLVFHGIGANGKSLLIDIITSLFPPDALSGISPQDLRSEYYIAMLDGKLLNTTTEMPSSTIASSEKFKAIVSGESIIGRKPHCEPIRFRPQAGHIFACNTLPKVDDTSAGFWRRMIVIEFKQDLSNSGRTRPEIISEVTPEKAAIAAWALSGAAELVKRGHYLPPASSAAVIESWRGKAMGESVGDWASQRPTDKAPDDREGFGELGPDAPWYRKNWTSGQKLFNDYETWCKRNKQVSVSHIEFGAALKKMGFRKIKLEEANYYNMIIGFNIPIDISKD
jgi:P4 family phage/plasmid primase-like protien